MKRSVILILFLLMSVGMAMGQTSIELPNFESKVLVMRLIETSGSVKKIKSQITISDGEAETYAIDLEYLNDKGENNIKIISDVMNRLEKQGYKLITSNGGGGGSLIYFMTTYIYRKE